MNSSTLIYALGALVVSFLTNYLVLDLSHKRGIFIDDHESDLPQKLHHAPTPRIGGLGIFVGILFMVRVIVKEDDMGLYLVLCLIPAFMAGFLEDLFAKISPLRRLLIMSVSGIMAIYILDAVVTDFGFFNVPLWVGIMITMIAILGLTNGTNMIDGFNGLSSGVCFIIFATYFAMSLIVEDMTMVYICLVCMASILGFLFFNFPWGKIFLGDGGAYSLGFLLAIISIMIVKRNTEISPWFVLVCLIYPVWEVIFSFSRRTLIHRLSPLHPDSKHVHQLIYRNLAGKNNPRTTLFIFPFIILFNLFAVYFYQNSVALFMVASVFIVSYTLFYYIYSRKEISMNKSPKEA